MTDAERKRLYRRIERNSRLRIPWYLRLASLLGIFEPFSRADATEM